MKNKSMSQVLELVYIGMLVVLTVGCGYNSDTQTENVKDETPMFTMGAQQLKNEYSGNEVAAKNKYKGKVVVVSGMGG